MPLSDHEQKVLKEIESALYAEDPKFFMYVSKAKGGLLSTALSARRSVSIAVMLVGSLFLVCGIFLPAVQGIPVFSIVGFVIILIGGAVMLNSSKHSQDAKRPHVHHTSSTLAQKMEARFRQRFM